MQMIDFSNLLSDYAQFINSQRLYIEQRYPSLDPEDILQDTHIKSDDQATKNPERWDSSEKIKANFHINVNGLCKDSLKHRNRIKRGGEFQRKQLTSLAGKLSCNATSPTQELTTEERQRIVMAELEKLTVEEQKLIYWRVYEELPYTEIAELTAKTESSLKIQTLRLRKKLKASLGLRGFGTTFFFR